MTIGNATSDEPDAQMQKQDTERDPTVVLDRDGTNKNAYNISLWTVSKSQLGSKASAQQDEVHYRVQDDNPTLLLKADNLLKCLRREFGITGVERYEGDALEIVIEPTNVPNGLSTAQNSGSQFDCTVVDSDSISLLPVIEEFIGEANSRL